MFIDGALTAALDGGSYESLDPYSGQPWARVPDATAADVDRAVAAARAALTGPWGQLTATQRGKLLREMAGQCTYYYAGPADKLQGSVIPSDKPSRWGWSRPSCRGTRPCAENSYLGWEIDRGERPPNYSRSDAPTSTRRGIGRDAAWAGVACRSGVTWLRVSSQLPTWARGMGRASR